MTRGLPASGKSTWSENQVVDSGGQIVRVTKDQLRLMLNASKMGQGKRERNVLRARDSLINTFLSSGVSVIVDDTNFNPFHAQKLQRLAQENGALFKIEDFTHVPLAECLRRDALRPHPVGEKVIRRMWQQYLYVRPQWQGNRSTGDANTVLENAIIVDVDGTVALMGERGPYDWHRVAEDTPNHPVIWMLHAAVKSALSPKLIFLSGRDGVCLPETRDWLVKHLPNDIGDFLLYQRTANDSRKDSVVKRELYNAHVLDKYNVLAVFDDRDQVVELWRSELGLPCFQVEYGTF